MSEIAPECISEHQFFKNLRGSMPPGSPSLGCALHTHLDPSSPPLQNPGSAPVYKDALKAIHYAIAASLFSETDNTHNRRAVAVYKDGLVVGYVTQELSSLTFWFFLRNDGIQSTAGQSQGAALEQLGVAKTTFL